MPRRNVTDRDALVRVAAAIVEAEGVAGARLTDVASSAGVSVGTVYNYFPSKDHLLDAVASRLEAEFVAALAVAAPARVPLREAVPDLVRAVLTVAAGSRSLGVLSERAAVGHAPGGEAPLIRGWIAHRVGVAQQAGEVAAVDASLVADLGFALLKAAMTRSRTVERAADRDLESQALLGAALLGLLPTPDGVEPRADAR